MNKRERAFYEKGNEITYEKVQLRPLLYIIVVAIGLGIAINTSRQVIEVLFYKELNFLINNSYLGLMFSLPLVGGFSGGILSYFGNKITISESFITIRRPAVGKKYIIAKSAIIAKQPIHSSNRGIDNYLIFLYLKNNKIIHTGDLHCVGGEFEKISKEFEYKNISDIKLSKEERRKLKNVKLDKREFEVKNNYFFKMITFLPIILSFLIVYFLFSDFNYHSSAKDYFHISCILTDKEVQADKDNNIYYMFTTKNNKTSEEYNISVTENEYYQFDINSKIGIEGKIGRLGILYDIKPVIEK